MSVFALRRFRIITARNGFLAGAKFHSNHRGGHRSQPLDQITHETTSELSQAFAKSNFVLLRRHARRWLCRSGSVERFRQSLRATPRRLTRLRELRHQIARLLTQMNLHWHCFGYCSAQCEGVQLGFHRCETPNERQHSGSPWVEHCLRFLPPDKVHVSPRLAQKGKANFRLSGDHFSSSKNFWDASRVRLSYFKGRSSSA